MIDPNDDFRFKFDPYVARVRDAERKLNEALADVPPMVEVSVTSVPIATIDAPFRERVHIELKHVL